MLYLAADTESYGLNPEEDDLLQAGFALYNRSHQELWSFEFNISMKTYSGNNEALAVNKLDLNHLRETGLVDTEAITISQVKKLAPELNADQLESQMNLLKMHDYLAAIRKDHVEVVLMCHNVPFDRPYLHIWFPWIKDLISYRSIDTIGVALAMQDAGKLNTKNVKLTTLTDHFKIPHTGAHTALSDAKACAAVYKEFVELIKYDFKKQPAV